MSNFNLNELVRLGGAFKEVTDEEVSNFEIGRCYSIFKDKFDLIASDQVFKGMKQYGFFSPVILHVNENYSIAVPSFAAYDILYRFRDRPLQELLQIATSVLLPEFTLVKFRPLIRIFKSRSVDVVKNAGRLAWKEAETLITTTQSSRIGSWMTQAEYDLMVSTSQLQKRSGGLTHVLLEGKEHYTDIAGKMYVEFDIPANTTIARGSGKGWGIFYEPESTFWKFYNNKGLNVGQPKVSNIQIIDRNGL